MRTTALAAAVSLLCAAWLLPAGEAPAVRQVTLNGHVFTLPAGFTIELVAGPPLVDRPITADFDEQGRLYVADSSGSNEKVDVQVKTRPHRIVRLEDIDGDGKFDRAAVFADKMMFPEGTMWRQGSLYVAGVPQIWKLTDTDGDGVADRREVWFDGKTMTGCANDLHGPYRGPDGWIYWCKGAFAKQTYERPGKAPFHTRAAHVFRARPDGSGLEPVMTGGMDNPVDLVFTPGGERIFTTTFFQFPGGGQRDGLVHAVYGGIYGKDWDVIHEPQHRWTGPTVMPVLTHLGPAAPAGLTRYESDTFGPEYRDNLFAALFNLQKVTRHVLEPHGATFKTRDFDFVVSNNKDFHPTDVVEDADGSLLIVDTGGWYKLCCPTSQLVKPDVLGGIYRVRRTGAKPPADPRGRALTWDRLSANELAALLGDARPTVRHRAIEALAGKGDAALTALGATMQSGSQNARLAGVWCATRIDAPQARASVRQALDQPDLTLRQAALHSISIWRDKEALTSLMRIVASETPHNRRAAAEALGRIGDRRAVPALFAALAAPVDRVLEHSLTFALIEIGDPKATAAGLTSTSPSVCRAAMIALDQMDGGGLGAATVTAQLRATDPRVKEAAWWVASRYPEWAAELSAALRERLTATATTAERDELVRQLAKLARSPATQQLLAECVADAAAPAEPQRLALRAMAAAGLKETPAAWLTALTRALASSDGGVLGEAVATLRKLRLPKKAPPALETALLTVGGNVECDATTRAGALAAVPGGLTAVEPAVFEFLRLRLNPDEPVLTRTLAAEALAHARLSPAQLLRLADALKMAGPMEMSRLLEAFAQSGDDKVGDALVGALQSSPARSGLRAEVLKPVLAKYGTAVQKRAQQLLASLDAGAGQQKAHLEDLLGKLPAGDVRRGQAVFNSPKAACATCHAIGYLGGNIGPDLTRIGGIRTERDLLESIVFPSASFVRGYEPVLVTTRDGKTVNGVPRKDAPDEVILVTGANQEVRIPREEIDEMQPGRISIMPAGLEQQLSVQNLADLVAFLRACR